MDIIRWLCIIPLIYAGFNISAIGSSTSALNPLTNDPIPHTGIRSEFELEDDDFKNNFHLNPRDSLVKKYKPAKVLDYDDARTQLYLHIYNINDTVTCMYSGYQLPLSRNSENPIGKLMKANVLKSIITEHSYPKSKGAKHGNAKSDMHHLFPVRLGVNVARFNHPFGDVKDEQCTAWYLETERYTRKPQNLSGKCAKKGDDIFEPRDEFKGNVARAVFYFYTMYREEADTEDASFFELQRHTLLKWHRQDPVDEMELKRTYMIASFQSGKPNPFVVSPTLVDRLYGDASWSAK